MHPFFSIIIPTLNEEKYISRLLECILSQESANFEVHVVDGHSSDTTRAIVESYTSKLPIHLHALSKPNLPLQKNTGAKEAKGEYLVFLDADMVIDSSFTRQAEKAIRNTKGLAFIPYVYPIEHKQYPEVATLMQLANQLIGLSLELHKPFSAGPSQIWERNTFLKIGGYDEIFGEDHHIMRKLHSWGVKTKQLPGVIVRFSLRRLKKDGRMKLFIHTIKSHIHLLFNDRVKDSYQYEMGGHIYDLGSDTSKDKLGQEIAKSLKRINALIRSVITEQ